MSEHIKNVKAAELRSLPKYYLNRSSHASVDRYMRNYTRIHVGFFALCWFYFMYCNPEFFADYRWVRSKLGLDHGEPWFPKYFRLEYKGKPHDDSKSDNVFIDKINHD